MKNTRSRSTLLAILAVVVIVLAWVVVRAGTSGPDAVQPGARSGASTPVATSSGAIDPASGLRWVAESALPEQARVTLRLIRAGGP